MSITWLTAAGGLAEPVEMYGSAKETWDGDKISCEVQLRCPWANRYAVLSNLLLNAKAWPYHPEEIAFARSGSIANDAGVNTANGSGNSYNDALIDVTFDSNAIADQSLEPTAEFLQLSPDKFKWGDSGGTALTKEESPGRLELGFDYCLTLSNLDTVPGEAQTLIGKVNDDFIVSDLLGLTFGPETLLFNPPKVTRKMLVSGTNKFSVQFRLTYRHAGWNTFWRASRPGGAGYDEIYDTVAAETYLNYTPASFDGLIALLS